MERIYTSNEVSELTGATLRQLQWWDEAKLLRRKLGPHPKTGLGRVRIYADADRTEIGVIVELREKGFSLHAIRKVLAQLRTYELWRDKTPGAYIVTSGTRTHMMEHPQNALIACMGFRSTVALLQLPGTANGNHNSTKVRAGSKAKLNRS